MRLRIRLFSLLVAVLITVPAFAQTYKWVDENGVTNYASTPPSPGKPAQKLATVADRISVYTPASAVTRAVGAGARGDEGILSRRIDSMERRLEAERQARQYAAAAESKASQAVHDQCVAERRVDCDGYTGYYPYGPVVVVARSRNRQPPFVPLVAVTGVTAGNVTAAIRAGGGGYNGTPGVINGSTAAFGSFPVARMSRDLPSR